MKKLFAVLIALLCIMSLVACQSKTSNESRDIITIYNRNFAIEGEPTLDLPADYEYIGDLPKDAANKTGLDGCKMYVINTRNSFTDFYLYQECDMPTNENIKENNQSQMAYVHWVLTD